MKQHIAWGVLLLGLGSGLAKFTYAQTVDKGRIEVTRQAIQTERQDIVRKTITLTDEEAKSFWPLYRDWRAKVAGLGDRKVSIFEQLVTTNAKLDDAQAKSMLDEWMKIKGEELKLQKDYIKKFRKILPEKKVAQFFQLEGKLDASLNYDLAGQVPLVQ